MIRQTARKLLNERGRRKGFTLIELIVAIGILVLLLVVFLPKLLNFYKQYSIKSAANEIIDTARAVNSASVQYYMDNNAEPASLSDLDNYLAYQPVPPASAKDPNYTGTYAYEIATDVNVKGTSDNDTVLELKGVNDDVCKAINEAVGIGNTIPTAVDSTADLQCYNDGNENVVLKVLFVH